MWARWEQVTSSRGDFTETLIQWARNYTDSVCVKEITEELTRVTCYQRVTIARWSESDRTGNYGAISFLIRGTRHI